MLYKLEVLAAIGDMPAEEGFGAIIGAALNGLLALALIFIVLSAMNRVSKKKNSGESSEEKNDEKEGGTTEK